MKNLFLLFWLIFFLPATLFAQTPRYKVADSILIGGNGWRDYAAIDVSTHRLFVSHGNRVHVIDLNNNKLISEITNLNGVHGIAFADEFGKGLISNGRSDTVTVFSLKTLKNIDNIYVTGKNPDAIVYDPFTKRIFTMNGRSSNATAIDAKTNKVIGTITFDGKPESCVSNNKGLMYVNLENKNQIEEFDHAKLKTTKKWSIEPGESPSGFIQTQFNYRYLYKFV